MKYLFVLLLTIVSIKAEAQSSALSIADSLTAVGNYSKAIEQFQSIKNPTAQIDLKVARAYKAIGNGNLALKAYKTSLRKDPNQVIAATEFGRLHIAQKSMNQLGLYYLKKQQYDIVERIGKKALESNPNGIEMTNLMALNYYNKGWTSEAIEWLEKLISLGQSSAFIHKRLGRSYAKQGDYEAAIEQYAIVLEENDKDPSVHLELARLYQRSHEFEKGIRHAEIAIFLNTQPLDEEYYTLATVLKLDGQFEAAIENYQNTLKENPEHIEAQYGIPVAADNYYKNKREVLLLYERFVKKYANASDYKTKYFVKLAQQRIDMLTQEVFMAKDKG